MNSDIEKAIQGLQEAYQTPIVNSDIEKPAPLYLSGTAPPAYPKMRHLRLASLRNRWNLITVLLTLIGTVWLFIALAMMINNSKLACELAECQVSLSTCTLVVQTRPY